MHSILVCDPIRTMIFRIGRHANICCMNRIFLDEIPTRSPVGVFDVRDSGPDMSKTLT